MHCASSSVIILETVGNAFTVRPYIFIPVHCMRMCMYLVCVCVLEVGSDGTMEVGEVEWNRGGSVRRGPNCFSHIVSAQFTFAVCPRHTVNQSRCVYIS